MGLDPVGAAPVNEKRILALPLGREPDISVSWF